MPASTKGGTDAWRLVRLQLTSHCIALPFASSAPRVSRQVTGPVALMEATEAYSRNTGQNVTVLAPGLVFAYNWHQARGNGLCDVQCEAYGRDVKAALVIRL